MFYISGAEYAWLITNRYVSSDARAAAWKLGVKLWDRRCLTEWLSLNYNIPIYSVQDDVFDKSLTIEEIDHSSGYLFEGILRKLLLQLGYREPEGDLKVGIMSDQGCDLLMLDEDNRRICVQAKRWKYPITSVAVVQVFAAKKIFEADEAIVITNNVFLEETVELARQLGVTLWGRDILIQMMDKAKTIQRIYKYPEQALYVSVNNSEIFHDLACENGMKLLNKKGVVRFDSIYLAIASGRRLCKCPHNNRLS
jgi:restriction system protein